MQSGLGVEDSSGVRVQRRGCQLRCGLADAQHGTPVSSIVRFVRRPMFVLRPGLLVRTTTIGPARAFMRAARRVRSDTVSGRCDRYVNCSGLENRLWHCFEGLDLPYCGSDANMGRVGT